MTRVTLQKLVHPGMSTVIRERNYDQVGGFVTEAASASGLATSQMLLDAYQLDWQGDGYVDVVRFELPPAASLTVPHEEPRPWPTYATGFLRAVSDNIVPVYVLEATRYPPGAEMWRVHADGSQELVTVYRGVARGWAGANGWRPSSRYFGTRAVWEGAEYAADVAEQEVGLTAFSAPEGDGWRQEHAAAWTREVCLDECELYELVSTAILRGVPVRVLEVVGSIARVQLLSDEPGQAEAMGATMIDPGVFELGSVRDDELVDRQLNARMLA